jgi:peroxiredoxin
MTTRRLPVLAQAPDFELLDTRGQSVHLANFHGRQPVVLVLLRGFV